MRTWAAQRLQPSRAEEVAGGSPHAPIRLRNQEAHDPTDLLCIAREAPVELAILRDDLPTCELYNSRISDFNRPPSQVFLAGSSGKS